MKICFFIRAMERGGAERQLTNLACGLCKRGHGVTVLTFYPGGALESELHDAGVTIHCLGKAGRWHIMRTLKALVSEVRRLRPDVLHSYLPTSNLLALLSKPFIGKTKVIIGVRASNMDLSQYDTMTAWSYRVERWLSRFADGVIANSSEGAEIYRTQASSGKVQIIPNGIDTDVFCLNNEPSNPLRENLGIEANVPLIGLVARVDPMKDHDTFLRAVAIVHEHQPDVQFICIAANAGSAAAKRIQERANDLGIAGCVHWAGPFDNMSRVYGVLDLLVLTSVCGEGFPNVVAEAMSCGVPAVVTDVGDAAMVVGETGRVVPISDAEAVATGMIEMLVRLKTMPIDSSSAVRNRIADNFSKDALVEHTMEVINKVVAV